MTGQKPNALSHWSTQKPKAAALAIVPLLLVHRRAALRDTTVAIIIVLHQPQQPSHNRS